MSKDWEKEYSAKSLKDTPLPARLLKNNINLLTGGQALDIASGTGQNAVFLSSQGYDVTAVDKSPSAAAALTHAEATIQTILNYPRHGQPPPLHLFIPTTVILC